MLTRKGWRLLSAAIVALIAVIAACGSTTSSSTPPTSAATSSAAPAATTQSSASPTAASPSVLDPFLFPEQDTPLSQATPQLKQIWTPYHVTIIPSRHTLETMPPVRTVGNLTGGAIGDAEAQSYLVAEYRDNAFSGWALRNDQPDFFNLALQGGIDAGSPEYAALKAGRAINDPACDLYPTNPAVVKLDDSTTKYLTQTLRFTLNGPYALVQTYVGPCDVTYVSPRPQETPFSTVTVGGAIALFAGHLKRDPVLGPLWFVDGAFDCGRTDPPVPPKELCQAAAAG